MSSDTKQMKLNLIPKTRHGLDTYVCLSAMQKYIRRGLEREAMEFACEMLHTSKNFCTMVCNRLEIISHEDIDTQINPHIAAFVKTACDQARAWYNQPNDENVGKCRMVIGNAIRLMCRAPKSREGDHFQAAVGLKNLLLGQTPAIPDWAYDKHTREGRRRGRGLDHFRAEAAKLDPPAPPDRYEDEAYQMWKVDADRMKAARVPMFVDEED